MDRKRILVIDDEENFTKLIKWNLEKTGKYEIRVENSGLLGFSATKEFKPHLILLDISMPDMDGSEVAFQLKCDEDTKDIPIVFLTAVAKKEEVEANSGIIGGHPFIAKPVELEQLIDVIERNVY
ncbi:MAG: response regulator [Candidatus Omnitrophota bacterium]|jgi:CheY-like chemotaxis protein